MPVRSAVNRVHTRFVIDSDKKKSPNIPIFRLHKLPAYSSMLGSRLAIGKLGTADCRKKRNQQPKFNNNNSLKTGDIYS